jgi:CelD/BcsL family acetyltransferase involved in cellulose biosynthesis
VATATSAFCGQHYSQYINSNTDGPASKYSLVGLLMFEMMEQLRAQGITSVDIGIGSFAYKKSWTEQVPVFDCVIPLSSRGRIAAAGFAALQTVKRTIKQNPLLWKLAKTTRAALNRQSKPASQPEEPDAQ